jgi:hypothetical protein
LNEPVVGSSAMEIRSHDKFVGSLRRFPDDILPGQEIGLIWFREARANCIQIKILFDNFISTLL